MLEFMILATSSINMRAYDSTNTNVSIVNVLSNGQISIFLLAYFFAGISVRNDHEKMKVYFIDDLTACMDDVNMLAFMDLLKHQMTSKKTWSSCFSSHATIASVSY